MRHVVVPFECCRNIIVPRVYFAAHEKVIEIIDRDLRKYSNSRNDLANLRFHLLSSTVFESKTIDIFFDILKENGFLKSVKEFVDNGTVIHLRQSIPRMRKPIVRFIIPQGAICDASLLHLYPVAKLGRVT